MIGKPKKTVLIIEDDNIQLKVLKNAFVDGGFEVRVASNGAEGLKVAGDSPIDAILLDRVMPVMDGITMMEKMLPNSLTKKKVPIILFTNLPVDDEARKMIIATGYNPDYILKAGCTLQDIVKKIRAEIAC